jgi:hypothetical protein
MLASKFGVHPYTTKICKKIVIYKIIFLVAWRDKTKGNLWFKNDCSHAFEIAS